MVERQDIDALLISALYGELTPAEETRLATHLDSHPEDRMALADLTRAREAVRESRILQVQYDPPQSISALLLQEAARRAPTSTPSEDGWFRRFTRSFMAQPAFVAAAMLVVVIGFATVISSRKGDHFAETSEPPAVAGNANVEPAATGSALDDAESVRGKGQAAAIPTAAGGDRVRAELASKSQAGSAGAAYGSAGAASGSAGAAYRVALEDGIVAVPPDSFASRDGNTVRSKSEAKPMVAKPGVKAATKKDSGFLELRTQEPVPKELDLAKRKTGENKAFEQEASGDRKVASTSETTNSRRDSFGPGGGAGASAGMAPPAAANAPATAPAQPLRNVPSAAAVQPSPPSSAPRAPATTREERVSADKTVNRTAPADAAPAGAAQAEGKSDPQFEWATAQHRRVTKQVRDSNCPNAATLALEIAKRAPNYYQQNVATDRDLKKCLSYINTEREREAERAQRAKPTKRATDEPAKATNAK